MLTDLNDSEHYTLYIVSLTGEWVSDLSRISASPTLTSLVERGLIAVHLENGETILRPTEEGALLARFYGEP